MSRPAGKIGRVPQQGPPPGLIRLGVGTVLLTGLAVGGWDLGLWFWHQSADKPAEREIAAVFAVIVAPLLLLGLAAAGGARR